MSDWSIHIPSAFRAETLVSKTMRTLAAGGIDPARATVWVPDDRQRSEYCATLHDHGIYAPVCISPHDPVSKTLATIGEEPLGLGRSRNQIIDTRRRGDQIVFIDDDITGIERATSPQTLEPVTDLAALFDQMFFQADAASATLWGLYPVANAYFMKPRITHNLTYIIGALFGMRVTHRPHEYVVLDDKEDFERSIRHYLADGVVLRNQGVCIRSRFYNEPGGMQVARTEERVTASAHWLAHQFPMLCSVNQKKDHTELRLRDKRK